MSKPVVKFSRGHLVPWDTDTDVARLYHVRNHPSLGNAETVRTSRVLSSDHEGDELVRIETLNTIYERE